MQRTLINPQATRRQYDRFHFSQAVRVGDTIWVSGQVGVDQNGRPAMGVDAQSRIAFENLKGVLAEAGAGLDDVVELMTFHTDMRGEIAAFGSVKDDYLPKDYPCWTAVGVSQLALDGLCVEIRAVAVAGSSTAKTSARTSQ